MKALSRRNPRDTAKTFIVTALALLLLFMFLSPFMFMLSTAFKTPEQISVLGSPLWPARAATAEYDGKEVETYSVPMNTCVGSEDDNSEKGLVLVKKGLRESTFADPDDLERGEFICAVSWRALARPWEFSPFFGNFKTVWDTINFPRLMYNTTMYAILSTVGVLMSCTVVAYGFSRFDFPGRDFLFIVLISTLFLPAFVTVIPTYTFFQKIGWVGTWLPLIVPTFFANAFDVFLLRQYFMTIPRDMDEAAMIDGASRFRILWSVILPQSYPALLAITVFHIVYAWNDYFGPLIYLSTAREKWPISVALPLFNGIYGSNPELIQAAALMAIVVPLILFILAQRFFIQGLVVTGVDK
ncbi:MAG: carbohydrate ABC transporter permease [Anaerolineae bacterium]|nr:carbohydrate ABC transporter permease [Anaerolineae bacterium]